MSVSYRETDGTTTEHYKGAVLVAHGEHNYRDDSYFFALVWDEEQQQVKEVEYAATAYYSTGRAETDATREVIELAVAQRAAAYLEEWEAKHNATIRYDMTARVTVKGETFGGVVAWIGEARAYTAWDAKYGKRRARYGIKVEGRKGYIFRNEGSPSLVMDVPGWTEEDRAEMTARAEDRARHDFREAIKAADVREPLPAAPAPGVIVDAQEADDAGMRLYAVGESFCEDGWAQQVAAAVVDEGAAEYRVMGSRADLSLMPDRVVTVFRALGLVARWAENDGARILHDGAGTVRIEREDGARLYLVPVRLQEAAGAPQEGGEQREAAEVCTHPSRCVTRPVGAVRATKTATGEAGMVGVFCSSHLSHPAEAFPDGYTYEYLTVDGRGPVETQEAPRGAETVVGALQGTEGDPVWVARRDEALGVLLGLMDGGAGRYRRTVLVKGSNAQGLSDTMPTSVARAYLAEEVADGGEVGRRGMSGGLLLVRANGARLELRPERGVA
jgi:hypothetical protein